MRIAIIGAMQEEVQLLVNDLEVAGIEEIGMRKYYTGKLFSKDVVIVFARWGKVAAASTVTTLIEKFNADLVLFTGVAGAANSSLNIGDIVVADKLVQHDMDCSALPGLRKFEIPLLGRVTFDVDRDILLLAQNSANHYILNGMEQEIDSGILKEFCIDIPKVTVGTIASGDQFMADTDKVRRLSSDIENLQCVEMEGAAVAQICYEHGVRYAVFRVISDKADTHADINFPRFAEKAASYFTSGIIKKFIQEIE